MPVTERPTFDLSNNWSPLTRNVLIALIGLYIGQLVLRGALDEILMWGQLGSTFRPWQLVTAYVVQGTPFSAFFGWLAIFFFLTPVYRDLGARSFWRALLVIWAGASLLTLGAQALGAVRGVHFGMAPIITMLIGFFGFRNPNATVYFYFFPIRGIWLAWIDGFLSLLWLLFSPAPLTLLPFLFWAGSWAWTWWDGGGFRRIKVQRQRRDLERRMARFEVIDGGRDSSRGRKPDDWVH